MLQNNVTVHEQEVSINIMKELKSSIQHSSMNLKISQEKLIFYQKYIKEFLNQHLTRTSSFKNK